MVESRIIGHFMQALSGHPSWVLVLNKWPNLKDFLYSTVNIKNTKYWMIFDSMIPKRMFKVTASSNTVLSIYFNLKKNPL